MGEQTQRFVLKTDLDSISTKCALVLPEQTALGIFHNVEKIFRIELLTNHAHRQATDELRLETVLDEIVRRDVLEQFVVHHLNWLRAKPDLAVSHTSRHLFFQLFKRAAHHK